MKISTKLFLLTALLSFSSQNTFAYDIAVENSDGKTIYYNYINGGTELEVTCKNYDYSSSSSDYSGSVVIPCEVTFQNRTRKVTSIGEYAFYKCTLLYSITIPNSVTSIGGWAFSNCSGLTSVTIPNSVTSIEDNAFYGCSGLTSVTIPNSVTSIGYAAFYECYGLTCITIPNSVTSIGKFAFWGCSGLTSVTIPNSVTSIGGYAFSRCSGLTSVTIPSSVTAIEESTFYECSRLKTLTLPEGLTRIMKSAFYGCSSLTEIVIPAKVEYIYAEAFAGYSSLQSVTCLAPTPPYAYDNTFSKYNIPLYVPAEAINDYQATNPWSKFSQLKTLSGEDAERKCATPTISYKDARLYFNCETEGVEYVSNITDTDIKGYTTPTIDLSVTYHVSVYATKSGYQNSDVAEGTLCWIEIDPKKEGISDLSTSAKTAMQAMAILIQTNNGEVSIEGLPEGTEVSIDDVSGMQQGMAQSHDGRAQISTSMKAGQVAVVKIGNRAVKVLMK